MEQEILIALGSNLGSGAGDPAETVRAAFRSLTARNLILRRSSRLYATPCFPAGTGPDYVNACAVIAGAGDAPGILTLLHEVEAEFGRLRRERWGSRTLDIDLLAIGGTVLLVLWSAGLAAAVGLVCYAVNAPLAWSLFGSGVVLALSLWWGPGGRRVRSPLGRVVTPASRTVGWWLIAVTVLLLAAGGAGGWVAANDVSWTPGTGVPFER